MNRLILIVAASVCAISATAAELPECIGKAAREFNVPPHLLESMALQEMDQPPAPPSLTTYGPMGLSISAMRGSARAIGVSPRLIAMEPCSNYRAAAYWLTGPSSNTADVNVWQMVNRFYYGPAPRKSYPQTERVREIFLRISAPAPAEVLSLAGFKHPEQVAARCMAKLRGQVLADVDASDGKIAAVDSTAYQTDVRGIIQCRATFQIAGGSALPGVSGEYSAQVTE